MPAMRSGTEVRSAYQAGAFALVVTVAVILAALAYEHIGGYKPCPLCLKERWAYYYAIPAVFAGLVAVAADHRRAAALLFFSVAIAYLANVGLGTYHAGAEWGFWPGPATCAGDTGVSTSTKGLLEGLEKPAVIRCDQASWRMFGLSFAGWNVVVSFVVFAATLKAAFDAKGR